MPLWKKEESDADSEDSEDKEIKAVQNMSKEGASAGNRVMDSDEDSEEKRTQVQAIEDKEGDNEADEEFDEEEFDGELQEEDVPEGEPLIPLGKDGKPMSEIDLYIHRAMEEKRRRRRIERAAEVEMALEKAKEEAEKGSLAGQKKKPHAAAGESTVQPDAYDIAVWDHYDDDRTSDVLEWDRG